MALKHAVLGLLSERRSYGYDIVQALSDRLGPAWQLSASTVYAALDQLEEEDLIRCCEERGGDPMARGGNRRVVYESTPPGREAFEGWISGGSWRQEPVRGELYLKVAMARRHDLPALLEAVALAERLALSAREEYLEAGEPTRGGRWQRATASLARGAAVARVEAELSWLAQVRDTLPQVPGAGRGLEMFSG
jgi:DNA-binding PadR family transcriptional regulator